MGGKVVVVGGSVVVVVVMRAVVGGATTAFRLVVVVWSAFALSCFFLPPAMAPAIRAFNAARCGMRRRY